MASLLESMRMEASSLKARSGQVTTALDENAQAILAKAEEIAEHRRVSCGDGTPNLFVSLEESLRVLMKARASHKAQEAALGNFSDRLADDATPTDVRAAFTSAVAAETTANDAEALERSDEPLRKLRKIVHDSDAASARGGGGPSSAAHDDALEEDGFAMTQTARSTRCVLTQMEMTATGPMRPVLAPCSHVFSYKGISEMLKKAPRGQPMPCPQAGCGRSFTLAQLEDDRALAKEIRKSAHDLD